jgi:hypothetical protein
MTDEPCAHPGRRAGRRDGRWGIYCTSCGAERFARGYWGDQVGHTEITTKKDKKPAPIGAGAEEQHGR